MGSLASSIGTPECNIVKLIGTLTLRGSKRPTRKSRDHAGIQNRVPGIRYYPRLHLVTGHRLLLSNTEHAEWFRVRMHRSFHEILFDEAAKLITKQISPLFPESFAPGRASKIHNDLFPRQSERRCQ